MKRALSWLKWFVLLGVAVACGVHVGNGLQKYENPNGFSVEYSVDLGRPVENSDRTAARFDNSKQLKEEQSVSSVEFKVDTATQVETVGDLWAAASRKHSTGIVYKETALNGQLGLSSVTREAGSLSAHYLLMTTTHRLLQITVMAYAVGRGMELIAPIAETFKGGNPARAMAAVHTQARHTWELPRFRELVKVSLDRYDDLRVGGWDKVGLMFSPIPVNDGSFFALAPFHEAEAEESFKRLKPLQHAADALGLVDRREILGHYVRHVLVGTKLATPDEEMASITTYLYDCNPIILVGMLVSSARSEARTHLEALPLSVECQVIPKKGLEDR